MTNIAVADEHAARRVGDIPYHGSDAFTRLVEQTEVRRRFHALAGALGSATTPTALTRHRLALANKESLVAGGSLGAVGGAWPGQIVPVDSNTCAGPQAARRHSRRGRCWC